MPAATKDSMASQTTRTIILAGGGSGGHISPGLALAEGLRAEHPGVRVIFLCSQRALDATMLGPTGERFLALPAQPFGLHPAKLLRFYRSYAASRRMAREIIDREGADAVVALGGFVAAPVMAAARDRKLPRFLLNLDDPPGKANRMMARMATHVLSAIDIRAEAKFRYERVGFPIRQRSIAPADGHECRRRLGLHAELPVLLVTGASQGASSINQLMIAMAASEPANFRGWQVLHLCGEGEVKQSLERAYQDAGVPALVMPFLHEMGLAWGAATLAVSRAGANSVAEVAANAVPAVFLPYPYHTDDHQRRNAEPLQRIGGAVIVQDEIEAERNLAKAGRIISDLLRDEAKRQAMRAAVERHRPANASHEIAKLVLQSVA